MRRGATTAMRPGSDEHNMRRRIASMRKINAARDAGAHKVGVGRRGRADEMRGSGNQPATAGNLTPVTPASAGGAVVVASLPDPASEASPDGPASNGWDKSVDRFVHARIARATAGVSPASLYGAMMDWASHLAISPGKQLMLAEKALQGARSLALYAASGAMANGAPPPGRGLPPYDARFAAEAWRHWPYNLLSQSFLVVEDWWREAATGVGGVTEQHEDVVQFSARQILDTFSPSNFPAANPEVTRATWEQGGANLLRGWQHFLEDAQRSASGRGPAGAEAFAVGRNVAVTPGNVVFRNHLIELIQYAPTTPTVRPEPILIVPAWIMKYYILDLSPGNSMVKYLVDQGYTVFMISWRNPDAADRDISFDDYRRLGPMAALDVISLIVPGRRVHAAGSCIGGTLLAVTAAAMARDGDSRLKTVTLFAAQTDFSEAGELKLFINEGQLDFLDDLMWEQGYLDARQMAGTFQLLRSNDLVWSYAMKNYLMGERAPMTDLMAWNADATRMPFRMHSEYLRCCFLKNDLAEGRFPAAGKPVALNDISVPIFAVGTERDHVAPWRSTFKIHLLTETDVTYLLTTGGHNAGIVSELGHKGRSYRVATRHTGEPYRDPDAWLETASRKEGSWWPAWSQWLAERSEAAVAPPRMGTPGADPARLTDAPGAYVLQT